MKYGSFGLCWIGFQVLRLKAPPEAVHELFHRVGL